MESHSEDETANLVGYRLADRLIDLAITLDSLTFRELDAIGLVPVAAALSKWRDNIG